MRSDYLLATLLLSACAGEGTAPDGVEFAKGKPAPAPPPIATILVFGGVGTTAESINDARQIAGTRTTGGGSQAFVWQNGTFTDLVPLAGAAGSSASEISASGVVAGTSGGHAVRWVPSGSGYGPPEALSVPGGPPAQATAISNAGVIGGISRQLVSQNPDVFATRAFLWNDGAATSAQTAGWVEGVNDAGTLIGVDGLTGWVRPAGGPTVALASLGGASSDPVDINMNGVIVGVSAPSQPANSQRATLWTNLTPSDLGTLGGTSSAAIALNDLDPVQVVGRASTGARRNGERAFIWTAAGGMRDLGYPSGATFAWARDINNNGWIVGWMTTSTGDRAVLWKLTGSTP